MYQNWYKTSSEFTFKTDIKLYTRVLYIKNYKLNAVTIWIFICLQNLPRTEVYPYLLHFDMYMKFKELPIKIYVFSLKGNVIKKENLE